MPDPLISLDTERASVQPGGQVRLTVTLTNTGTLVEGFWLQVLGPAAAWAEVVPLELSVYPRADATAAVIFSPPSDNTAPSGLLPFGVLASSTLDVNTSAAAEGDLEIGEMHGLQAKIIPVTSSGRWRGRHVVQIDNWGNTPAQLRIVASDPDERLGFYVSPDYLDLPPGGHGVVRLSVRAKQPFLRGTPARIPFQVIGEPLDGGGGPPPATPYGDPSRPVIDAALNQKPILSRTVMMLGTLLIVGLVALVAFVLTRQSEGAALASRGSPPKGVLRVDSVTPESVTLSWDPVELADGYKLQHIDPAAQNTIRADDLDAALTATTVVGLQPERDVCFRLTVTRAGLAGLPSDLVCTRTAAAVPTATPAPSASDSAVSSAPPPPPATSAPASTSATPTPTFTPGDPNTDPIMKQQWIAVETVLPKTVAEADVRIHVQQLVDAGVQAGYLDRRSYPRLVLYSTTPPPAPSPTPEDSWVVFVGPFPTQADADVQCPVIIEASAGESCFTAQPDPPL